MKHETDDVQTDIQRANELAVEYEAQSDLCFARGDILNGSKFFRWHIIAAAFAQELAEREGGWHRALVM